MHPQTIQKYASIKFKKKHNKQYLYNMVTKLPLLVLHMVNFHKGEATESVQYK